MRRPTIVAGSTWPRMSWSCWMVGGPSGIACRECGWCWLRHEPTAAHLASVERWASQHDCRCSRLGGAQVSAADLVCDRPGGRARRALRGGRCRLCRGGFHSAGLHSVIEPAAFGTPVSSSARATQRARRTAAARPWCGASRRGPGRIHRGRCALARQRCGPPTGGRSGLARWSRPPWCDGAVSGDDRGAAAGRSAALGADAARWRHCWRRSPAGDHARQIRRRCPVTRWSRRRSSLRSGRRTGTRTRGGTDSDPAAHTDGRRPAAHLGNTMVAELERSARVHVRRHGHAVSERKAMADGRGEWNARVGAAMPKRDARADRAEHFDRFRIALRQELVAIAAARERQAVSPTLVAIRRRR